MNDPKTSEKPTAPKPLLCRMAAVVKELFESAAKFKKQDNDEAHCCTWAAAERVKEECESFIQESRACQAEQDSRVLTCVYCGQEYPQGTPASGHEVLTEHIKVCEKHPMRKATDQLTISKRAIAHTLNAICDDAQKFYLMGGRFSGSFSKLAEAHAQLHGLDIETVYEKYKPHDHEAYERYCDEREADERLLTYCRENRITLPKD